MALHNSSEDQAGSSNALSNSLLNDSAFWKDFLKDDSYHVNISDASIKKDKLSLSSTPEDGHDEEYKLDEDKLLNDEFSDSMFYQVPDLTILNKRTPNRRTRRSFSSPAGHQKTRKKDNSQPKSKKCKYDNRELQHNTRISNYSYLYKIKHHVEKCIENKTPTFLLKDILRAKQYFIFNELRCKNLCQIDGVVFMNVICRGTVVGLAKQGTAFTFLIDDGTASLWCTFHEEYFNKSDEIINNFPITEGFDVPSYYILRSEGDIERGMTVQALGTLNKYKKIFSVKKLYREPQIILRREISYLHYVKNLHVIFEKWKQDISNIYI